MNIVIVIKIMVKLGITSSTYLKLMKTNTNRENIIVNEFNILTFHNQSHIILYKRHPSYTYIYIDFDL